jgi:surface protein
MTTFVSTWNIPAGTTLVLPINANTTINCVVNWGDTATNTYTNYIVNNLNRPSHQYQNGGTIQITITGTLPGWSFLNALIDTGVAASASLLVSITSFGGMRLSSQGSGFLNCINLEYIPEPPVNSRFNSMFDGCSKFNADISGWDVSTVTTSMSQMFAKCLAFNSDLSLWKVSNVTDMHRMFIGCSTFNADISQWDVSKVNNMLNMFTGCSEFNRNLSWNVSKVTNMSGMFDGCSKFNGNISTWEVVDVTNMSLMFNGCSEFNSNLSLWKVSKVTNMNSMFDGCSKFNGNISTWDVVNVTDMRRMFFNCLQFRSDISSWKLSGISANANAPTLTEAYINAVQPNFSTQYPTAWSFTAPVTAAVIETILPVANRTQYYMNGLRLVRGFKSTWSITIPNRVVFLPFTDGAILNCTVHWGDDTSNAYNYTVGTGFPKPSHTYPNTNATYTLTITGSFTGWSFGDTAHISRTYLRTISYYGGLSLSPNGSHFQGCTNLTTLPTTTGFGTLALPTNCSNMFESCTNFTGNGILSLIPDQVTNMSSMFSNCTVFNGNISTWNVTEVTTMSSMFSNCTAFNGNIPNWNVQKVENMSNMFFNCSITGNGIFNLTANNMATDMSSMFSNCTVFNGNISTWNVTQVRNMSSMFSNCTAFNGNIPNWNVQKVENMSNMFFNCINLTGNGIFNLTANNMATDMSSMFSNCTAFNGNISTWDVQKVENMSNMFLLCANFKQDVSNWIVIGILSNANAPAFTNDYIKTVKPKFSSGNPNAWKFTGPGVTVKVIETILPDTASRALYTMDGLRLILFTNNNPKSSAISTSSPITNSYNSVINRFI